MIFKNIKLKENEKPEGCKTEEEIWGRRGFSVIDLEIPCPLPIFKKEDYFIVNKALLLLPEIEREAVILKFWSRLDTAGIARVLKIRTSTVTPLLCQAYTRLKRVCLENPSFSRFETIAFPVSVSA